MIMPAMRLEVCDCPLCGSGTYRELFSDCNRRDGLEVEGTYARCLECDTVYLRRRPRWDEILALYPSINHVGDPGVSGAAHRPGRRDDTIPSWNGALRKVRFRPHSWPLEPAPPRRARLLDVGCGNGDKLDEFYRRGYDVWGVDVDPNCIEACRRAFPHGHFVQAELDQARFPSDFFHCVRLDNCLEHVPDPRALMTECYRILAPGGRALIYVPHADGLSFRLMKRYSISAWIPFHLQLFTRASMRNLLRGAGFAEPLLYSFNPSSWLFLSVLQWAGRRETNVGRTVSLPLFAFCYATGWVASKIGLGEELVADAWKPLR